MSKAMANPDVTPTRKVRSFHCIVENSEFQTRGLCDCKRPCSTLIELMIEIRQD